MSTPALPGFPPSPGGVLPPSPLRGKGLALRRAGDGDLAWLPRLYASTRADEMVAVPWSETAKQAFLAEQFGHQHRHYVAHFGDADFLIVEQDGRPLGRYYLQCNAPDHLLVDISLWPEARGHGIGSQLIRASQDEAARQGCGMRLHVLQANQSARRLYERLGFVVTGAEGFHHHMQWRPAAR